MTLNSVPYLVALALAVPLFWRLPVRFRSAFVLLLSLAFYASWGLVFVWVPLLIATLVYGIGKQVTKDAARRKVWIRIGIGLLLALLAFFKYRGLLFLIFGFPDATSVAQHHPVLTAVIFPVGISFYTFEAIAYLVDLRQGRVKLPPFFELCLFFFFWPNILSGPIVRARELVPQLGFAKLFEPRFVFEGMDRLVWGLVQKNVVANLLGVWVDRGFATTTRGAPSTLDGWFLAVAFAVQIYFDFAGYSNMAIGTARLLGVTLPENFRFPYHAGTPAEFWSRWHMTLSRWIRDYLFFPINTRWIGSPLVLYGSMLGVMALVGLWHGAGWGFVVWGLLHGCYLVVYRMYERWKQPSTSQVPSALSSSIWRVVTLIAVIVAWVPFRAATLQSATTILSSMFVRFAGGGVYGTWFYIFTFAIVLFCAAEPSLVRKLGNIEEQAGIEGLSAFRIIGRPILYTLGLILFLLFDENNAQFIYSQF